MLTRMTIVLAQWCPHCVPLHGETSEVSLQMTERIANELNISLRVLDIDHRDPNKLADQLVREHGDYVDDYLIPQVFLEFSDGRIQHIFTGFSEGVHVTRSRWKDFLESDFYKELLDQQRLEQGT